MNKENPQSMIPQLSIPTLFFPGGVYHHTITSEVDIATIEQATEKIIFARYFDPHLAPKGLSVGTVMKITRAGRTQDNTMQVILTGLHRATLESSEPRGAITMVSYKRVPALSEILPETERELRTIRALAREYIQVQGKSPGDILAKINQSSYPNKLIDTIASNFPFETKEQVKLLTEVDASQRIKHTIEILTMEIEYVKLRVSIEGEVHRRLREGQKEYFLQEQIKEIHRELGQEDEEDEILKFQETIENKTSKKEVVQKVKKESNRLKKLPPLSPESGVIRSYLEWIVGLPWKKESKDTFEINRAREILDRDHYDMKKVKERILDFIAVKKFNPKAQGAILCFVGPPGTGKTSLGKSIAEALNKKFLRISLGGVRDEAEIRGHRRTYLGALPGKIIQAISKCGTSNPVFLLDEIDKLGSDFRGDPSSALLEVLDPEQNSTFTDHYLEVPYDLSKVLFIATANSLHTIPAPLLDRMEVIEIPGYSRNEKFQIAKRFLIPKQVHQLGMEKSTPTFSDEAIDNIINLYTRESGVRQLEREIGSTLRKAGRNFLENHSIKEQEQYPIAITEEEIKKYLGVPKYKDSSVMVNGVPGVAHGLAWTEVGGKVLRIETTLIPGKEPLLLTGNLGTVMQESAKIALSYIKARSKEFSIDPTIFDEMTIHIHVPQGAVPKDGPSAGISITMALLSILTGKPLLPRTAMTGEITLTGEVTAIGGVKEKLLAAHRNGMTGVLLPQDNEPEVTDEIPEEIQKDLTIHYVSRLQEAIDILFKEN